MQDNQNEVAKQNQITSNDGEIFQTHTCPSTATGEIMFDPVFARDDVNNQKNEKKGHTYERETIERWLENNNTSPLTRNSLSKKDLEPDISLKRAIDEFLQRYPTRWSDVYVSQSLINKLVSLLESTNKNEFERTLDKDPRFTAPKYLHTKLRGHDKTLLTLACEKASLEILTFVLNRLKSQFKSYRHDNDRDVRGLSMFTTVANRLKAEGADIILKALEWSQSEKQKALSLLYAEKNDKTLELFLRLNKELIREKDDQGNDYLMRAIKDNRHTLISFLLTDKEMQTSIDVNTQNSLGETPIILAVKLSQSETQTLPMTTSQQSNKDAKLTVEWLLQCENLNLHAVDTYGKSAMQYVAEKQDLQIGNLIYPKLKANGISIAQLKNDFPKFMRQLKQNHDDQVFSARIKFYEYRLSIAENSNLSLLKIIEQQKDELKRVEDQLRLAIGMAAGGVEGRSIVRSMAADTELQKLKDTAKQQDAELQKLHAKLQNTRDGTKLTARYCFFTARLSRDNPSGNEAYEAVKDYYLHSLHD